MLILALDSATPAAGVALLDGLNLIKEEFYNNQKKHSGNLMTFVDRVLNESEKELKDIDVFALTMGPGSFTGLRVGMASIKGLSFISKKPVVGITTLDVIAANIFESEAIICPLLDARKGEVYTALYKNAGGKNQRISDYMACSPDKLLDLLEKSEHQGNYVFLGDGARVYQEIWEARLGERLYIAPPHLFYPRAAALAFLAREKALQGEYEDIHTMSPFYLRLSEAEYKLSKGEL